MTNKLEELKKKKEEAQAAFDAALDALDAHAATHNAALDAHAAFDAAKEAYNKELNKNKNNE